MGNLNFLEIYMSTAFLGRAGNTGFRMIRLTFHIIDSQLQPRFGRHADLNAKLIEDVILRALDQMRREIVVTQPRHEVGDGAGRAQGFSARANRSWRFSISVRASSI